MASKKESVMLKKLGDLVERYDKVSEALKTLESKKKELRDEVLSTMEAAGVDKYGTRKVVRFERENLDKVKLRDGLLHRGVDFKVVEDAFKEATSVKEQVQLR